MSANSSTKALENYVSETFYFDYSSPELQELINDIDRSQSIKEQAIAIYLKVRDGLRYNAYTFHTGQAAFKSSEISKRPEGHCLDKAVLLISCFRGLGIPAKLHLVKIKNHIGVERIIELFDTDELTPHGYVDLYLEDEWVSCTPAFNKALCEKLNVDVLEFDGVNDSIFQEYDKEGGVFMEYLEDYGSFEDFPYDFVLDNMDEHYPKFAKMRKEKREFSL